MFEEKISVKSNGRYINARSYVGLGVGDDCFVSCTNMGEVRYQNTQGNGGGRMKLPVDVVRMRSHKDRAQVFAAGGREQELSVWDAETACTAAEWVKPAVQPLFKSKNIADDGLGLRPPVWITDMQFLDANTSVPQLAVSTGHGQIRIYDAKAQQRPVQDWQITKHPILHILASHLRPELFFADNMGNMQQLDLRTGKVIGGYKGIAGAVCDMALSEDGRKVAEVGLDRFLRVYETDGMRLLRHRAYIKQRVSQVVWDWDEKDLNQREIDQIEAEHIWQTMDTLGEEQRTKKGSKRKAL
ncbi:WD40-repeat-containing domain protein [Kickxella alabastrina]|uniref:WD40-repeat-containing domain protein n=1 Tax=Kickxella alabastrina TaxID=61397 RepID=UPI0022204CCD|nr:WD40-repeat-containing domain protein [Kickxella alabastrina]KAI7824509.1 WD40-repeat-containing domain protein [Kickxella alabastrina]